MQVGTGLEMTVPHAVNPVFSLIMLLSQSRLKTSGRGGEKLVTLLQDFCSRRCHCQETERRRGREGGQGELERAGKHLPPL